MKKIQFKSPLGILLFVILPLVVILAVSGIRLDLTKEKRYTLSDSTIKVLESVKKPLLIEVYLEGDFPADFKQLQSETKFMLESFRKVNSKVDFKFIDPIKSAIPKDTLLSRGIYPSVLDDRKSGKTSQIEIYPYALIKNGNTKVTVPLIVEQNYIDNAELLTKSIENLEYNLFPSLKLQRMKASKK
ncbi:DUF7088 domain-containing protein [Chryseobacterium arachidis]